MILFDKLINLLPSHIKPNDTYKDENGLGILERFLNVCGEYFKDYIVSDIDNIMSILDFDKKVSNSRDFLFINCIWEFLGSIPYGYGALLDENSNNPWKENASLVPRAQYYDILKYAVSLYKIRGTVPFYTILLRFYGLNCKVLDPTGTEESPDGYGGRRLKGNEDNFILGTDNLKIKEKGSPQDIDYSQLRYDSDAMYDSEDSSNDSSVECLSCSEVYITIWGKTLNQSSKERVLLLLNRFRPVNVLPFDTTNVSFINN